MHIRQFLQSVGLRPSFLTEYTEEDNLKHTTSRIHIHNIDNGMSLWNVVSIRAEVSHDAELNCIELYIDDQLLSQNNGHEISSLWNTNKNTDGEHSIRVKATDFLGNTFEKRINVYVKNILVSISSPSNLLSENTSGYVFLSDKYGKVICTRQLKNKERFELRQTGYESDSFFLTEAYINQHHGLRLRTFANLERGSQWTLSQMYIEQKPHGSKKINFKSIDEKSTYYATNYGGLKPIDSEEHNLLFNNHDDQLYVTRRNNDGICFNLFNDLKENATIDLNQVANPANFIDITFNNSKKAMAYIVGFNGDSTDNGVIVSQKDTGGRTRVTFPYPGDIFENYLIVSSDYGMDYCYTQKKYGIKNGNHVGLEVNSQAQIMDGKLTYQADGNFTFMQVSLASNNFYEDVSWHYILPKANDMEIPLLELPDALSYFKAPESISSRKYFSIETISTYNDLKAFIGKSKKGFHEVLNTIGMGYEKLEY
ncbi:Ig-like domain-containing protein [Fulvivirga ligni]|uniref:Ig-like domain-containing protein n=1 Tax=Fulvivirga ligni TaxID=2904246 RepID=UPI001F26829E|nr:Ig-like domain-containing protein [Fulvivirga ligni]UII19701.1 Ig-like domain-containing protein [Fulvivirga ligni]